MEAVKNNSPQPDSKNETLSNPKPTPDLQNGAKPPAYTVTTVDDMPDSEMKDQKSANWSERTPPASGCFNPYLSRSSSSPSIDSSPSFKETMNSMRSTLGRWGSNVKEAAKRAEDLAGNTWQHLKTSPSVADAAMGRLVHSSKVLAEGGYEKIFSQTFDILPEEKLQNSYACYLSTSAGPVMGILYVSTVKLAFCSDDPLPYKHEDQTEWSFYKVVIPLQDLKAVNRSSNRLNASEKYIQIITEGNHEFWYMGFLNYEDAVNVIQAALQSRNVRPAST